MQIYIAEGTQQTGPFDLETIKAGLRAGKYQPAQLAWYEGAAGWEPISHLPGMEAAVAPPPPAPPAPPPYSPTPPAYPPASFPPGTYATPPPPAFIPVVSAPYVPGPGTGPPKRSVLAIIGSVCLGLLAVLFGLAKIARVFLPSHSSSSSSYTDSSTPTPSPTATPVSFFKPSPPASGTQRFVADRSNYSGDLEAHFVAFSFDYPEGWTVQENVDDCYVTLKHFMRQPSGKNVQVEFVSFSYAYNRPGYPLSTHLSVTGPQLLDMMVSPMLKDSPLAMKTSARGGRFGKYASEEIFVTDRMSDKKTGLFCRLAVVAQGNSSTDGLGVNFISSELAGTKAADTLGESGGLRTIRDSFRFGP